EAPPGTGRDAVPPSHSRRRAPLSSRAAVGDSWPALAGFGHRADAHADVLLSPSSRRPGVDDLQIRRQPPGGDPGRLAPVRQLSDRPDGGDCAWGGRRQAEKAEPARSVLLPSASVDRAAPPAPGWWPARVPQLSGARPNRFHVRALVTLHRHVVLLVARVDHRGDRGDRLRAWPPPRPACV